MKIRIGGVPYGVGAPLLAGLDSDPAATFVQAPPTQLIARLRTGELEAALVSSIEAIRQPGYAIAQGLGIACKREIRSVRAFRRRGTPIRSVGLDQSSATSVALLRILLARRFPAEAPELDAAGQPVSARRCRYTPHSLRATTATLLDEAGVGIKKVQELLGHRDIRVTQTYIKLGNDTRKSASHEVPL